MCLFSGHFIFLSCFKLPFVGVRHFGLGLFLFSSLGLLLTGWTNEREVLNVHDRSQINAEARSVVPLVALVTPDHVHGLRFAANAVEQVGIADVDGASRCESWISDGVGLCRRDQHLRLLGFRLLFAYSFCGLYLGSGCRLNGRRSSCSGLFAAPDSLVNEVSAVRLCTER